MKKFLLFLFSIGCSLPALACDEDYGQGQRYSTGYYLQNGKLTKSKVENCSNGMQEQSHTFDNGTLLTFININLAMTASENGYKTEVYINGKEARQTKRLKGIPKNFAGECYKPKAKGAKKIFCI